MEGEPGRHFVVSLLPETVIFDLSRAGNGKIAPGQHPGNLGDADSKQPVY